MASISVDLRGFVFVFPSAFAVLQTIRAAQPLKGEQGRRLGWHLTYQKNMAIRMVSYCYRDAEKFLCAWQMYIVRDGHQ